MSGLCESAFYFGSVLRHCSFFELSLAPITHDQVFITQVYLFIHEHHLVYPELLDLIEGDFLFSFCVESGLALHSCVILLSVMRGEE